MSECLFCKIIKSEIPSHKVYEDDNVLAFLDIQPCAKGHTVVIPKNHAGSLLDLPDEKIGPLFVAVKKVAHNLKNKLNADGLNVGINIKKVAGQVIDHLHIHIFPRYENDGGGSAHSIVNAPPEQSLEDVLEIVKM